MIKLERPFIITNFLIFPVILGLYLIQGRE